MRRFLVCLLAVVFPLSACNQEEQNPVPPAPSAADSVSVALPGISVVSAIDILNADLRPSVGKVSDGTLVLSFAGEKATLTLEALANYDGSAPMRRYCNTPIGYTFDMGPNPALTSSDTSYLIPDSVIDLGQRSKGTIIYLSGMPDGLMSLRSVRLTEDSHIDVTLSIVDPCFTDGVINPSFSVDMRRFFGARESIGGILSFDAPLSRQNGWSTTKTFHLTDVAFDPQNFDADGHKLKLDAAIGLGGSVSLTGLATTPEKASAAPERLQLAVNVVLRDVAVSAITGRFSFSSKAVSYSLPMNGVSAKGTQLLNLSSSKITIAGVSDVPAACEVATSLDVRSDRRSVAKADGLCFGIAAAGVSPAEGWGTFGKSSSDALGVALSKAFDNITFSSVLTTNENVEVSLPVGTEFGTTVAPLIECPVVPREGYVVEHHDTLNVPGRLISALKEGAVRLEGVITNTLPVDVSVGLVGYSENGQELLRVTSGVVCSERNLPVSIEVANKVGSSIDDLSVFIFSVRGVFGNDSRALKESDSVVSDIHFVLHK